MHLMRKVLAVHAAVNLLLLLVETASLAAAEVESVAFIRAGCTLEVPRQWQVTVQQDTLWNETLRIDARVKARDDTISFDDAIQKINESRNQLAEKVKENQRYSLLQSVPFAASSKLTGGKSVYGYSAAAPSAISYYFFNDKKEFVEIRLEFRTWETAGIWQEIDGSILSGLRLN